jgi:Fanconi anemia group M protein
MKEQVVNLIVDHREAPSGLIDELMNYEYTTTTTHVSTHVETAQLPVGDVVCSDRVCIERKTCEDFVDSFINRDIFGQVIDMIRAYPRSIMILEGDSIFGIRNISPEALRGSQAGLAVGMRVPIISTKNVTQTAALAVTIARREQFRMKRSVSMHGKRSNMTMPQRQIYVVSSIGEGVGVVVAEDLLKHFHSVQAVMNASIDELMEVKGVGRKIAEKIHEIVRGEYKR